MIVISQWQKRKMYKKFLSVIKLPYNKLQGNKDDSPICFCEYINSEGERSHLLATCCNCEAIDETCDRVISLKKIDSEILKRIQETVLDRLRVPWPGGAKQVPGEWALSFCLVPMLLLFASISFTMAVITNTVLLPTLLFTIHRCIQSKRNPKNVNFSGMKKPRSQFYLSWLIVSCASLFIVYNTQVITWLEITPHENLAFLSFAIIACSSLFIVKRISCQGFERFAQSEDGDEDTIESGAWRFCGQCQYMVPREASHCSSCSSCYIHRDHHCLWLNVCISSVNDRWFLVGMLFALIALIYGSHLTYTTICNPTLLDLSYITILMPSTCPNAYVDFSNAISFASATYAVTLAVLVTLVVLQQVVCITLGIRLREYRRRRQVQSSLKQIIFMSFSNWFSFWWRR
ncbi:zinc finger DHHC-type palmitoyltransferase GABPI isoform X2 [Oratosquilla oratoria]|uniref:zinc finger DHHC-type palmitoyltransferase GABPI isoform X2 n=1 Tax=Oratosquilla oratoria TaxID=337810 RepID=UPI003F75D2A1